MTDNQQPAGESTNPLDGAAPPAATPAGTTPQHPVDVFLLLTDADRVLLGLRSGTGYADGQWNLPSVH